MTHDLTLGAVAPQTLPADADPAAWVDWYWCEALPAWVEAARAPGAIGFHDVLDESGAPTNPRRRTILAQARLLFAFSHIALQSGAPRWHGAAQIARDAVAALRKAPGLYCLARSETGAPTGDPADEVMRSYDLSFVILGLATWGRLSDEDVSGEIEACWRAVETVLTDPATGLMLEHDALSDPAAPDAPPRAQNPHMHLFEACLQAYEMTGAPDWLRRAGRMRAKGLEYFFDDETGTIAEFIAPDLSPLPSPEAERREIGHQCEWAWLLLREADLGGDPASRQIAARLLSFADRVGYESSGPMAGAIFDAVSADETWREDRFLLWPQTEAIKSCAVRAQDPVQADRARALAGRMFRSFFAGRCHYVNQLDQQGGVIWSEALSRLQYHTVLALTEGARAGLWRGPA
ncbi:AGE family epimerase/isomerase [Salipiger sp. 1_MG-2023]|uniref:AGE family epimerase/isomerase n=1 Tax=Salipiger sp. 1_MG-2023 TaxID=3062665 RepID=UPI0026E2315E|nr:AGE family epimerase/isomerase [Salipiger sp. 1_MG-2023]MDO6585105.1 AGE family epimerase/isomerase [Salipiger sp. 1_MG-2023]